MCNAFIKGFGARLQDLSARTDVSVGDEVTILPPVQLEAEGRWPAVNRRIDPEVRFAAVAADVHAATGGRYVLRQLHEVRWSDYMAASLQGSSRAPRARRSRRPAKAAA